MEILIMKTKQNKPSTTALRASLITISLIGSMLVAGPATAASACKGLDNSSCDANASCGWVEGYERKDGRTVKSFCRTKAVKKLASGKSNAKKVTKSVARK